jgi:diguanylate cyclase (GGDEF)-like protein
MTEPASRPPLALLASSSQWVARSIDSILAPQGYSVVRLFTTAQVLERAAAIRPDLLLLDTSLNGGGGIRVCRKLRESTALDPSTPFIVIGVGPATRRARLESLRAGAWDHLVLPIDAEELLLKLSTYLRSKAFADTARENSLLDPVTGCYTTRGLLKRAHELGADASRTARALGSVTLAATLHENGEGGGVSGVSDGRLIRRVAELIGGETRDSDSLGRVGDNEFLVLAPDADVAGVVSLAERLARAVEGRAADEAGKAVTIRAGCFAVGNFREAAIDTVELMTRSTLALRQLQAERGAPRVHFFHYGGPP